MNEPRPDGVPVFLERLYAITWRLLIVTLGVVVVVLALTRLRVLVLPVIAALIIATVLIPTVNWLHARRVPRAVGTPLVMLFAALLLGGGVSVIVPPTIAELSDVGDNVLNGIEEIQIWLVEGPLSIPAETVEQYREQILEQFRENASVIVTGVLSQATLGLEIVASVILTIPLVFFFLKDGSRMWRWIVAQLDTPNRDFVNLLGARSWRVLSNYIRGVALLALIDATFIGIGLVIIGVPLVIPLAVLTFLGAFIPILGAIVTGAIAVLVALVSGGPVDALLVLVLVIAVQQLESNVVSPMVLGRAAQLHPVAILGSVTAGTVLAGVIGAFLAVPVAAVAYVVYTTFRTRGLPSPPEAADESEEAPAEEADAVEITAAQGSESGDS